jgi:hypothetical protein
MVPTQEVPHKGRASCQDDGDDEGQEDGQEILAGL